MTERRCIITRNTLDSNKAIRLVVDPAGQIVFDLKGKLPGRGYWISADKKAVEILQTNRKKRQQIFGQASLPENFSDSLQNALKKQIIQQIGIARRAGLICFGFQKIKEWINSNQAALAFVACDASSAETDRLRIRKFGCPVVEVLSASELGAIFSREHIAYMVFNSGNLTENIYNDYLRLQGLRQEHLTQ